MGLDFGWRKDDLRESYWPEDDAFFDVVDGARVSRIPATARTAWDEDGDASHLRPYVREGAAPTRITFRVLSGDERRRVEGVLLEAPTNIERFEMAFYTAFRIGVDFPDLPQFIAGEVDPRTRQATQHARVVTDHGLRVLAKPFVDALDEKYRGIVDFYGAKVFDASFPAVAEKKASWLRSMLTPPVSSTEPTGSAPNGSAASAPSPEGA